MRSFFNTDHGPELFNRNSRQSGTKQTTSLRGPYEKKTVPLVLNSPIRISRQLNNRYVYVTEISNKGNLEFVWNIPCSSFLCSYYWNWLAITQKAFKEVGCLLRICCLVSSRNTLYRTLCVTRLLRDWDRITLAGFHSVVIWLCPLYYQSSCYWLLLEKTCYCLQLSFFDRVKTKSLLTRDLRIMLHF